MTCWPANRAGALPQTVRLPLLFWHGLTHPLPVGTTVASKKVERLGKSLDGLWLDQEWDPYQHPGGTVPSNNLTDSQGGDKEWGWGRTLGLCKGMRSHPAPNGTDARLSFKPSVTRRERCEMGYSVQSRLGLGWKSRRVGFGYRRQIIG